jgi:DNA-binding NarL/FixJ family response regulator
VTDAAVRVLLVDDHELLAQPLAIALGLRDLEARIAPLGSAAEVVATAERTSFDLVLLDLDLGGSIGDGANLVPDLVATGTRVLVVTGSTAPSAAGHALELGAIGVVYKHEPFGELVSTVVAAAHGEAVMDLEQRRALLKAARDERRRVAELGAPFDRLSVRESQVLRALADGLSVSQIAVEWVVSEATVRTQVRGVLTKLGVGSQLAAVARARQAGWLPDPG